MTKKFTKKITGLALALVCCTSTITPLTAQAATPSSGTSSNFNITSSNGTLYIDGTEYYSSAQAAFKSDCPNTVTTLKHSGSGGHFGWYLTSTKNYSTAYDRDRFICKSSGVTSYKQKVSSETTAQITGSTKFDFKSVAQASMSITIGTKWGKTKELEIAPKKGLTYDLESYLIAKKRNYQYDDATHNKTYYAASHDKVRAVIKAASYKNK